MRLAVLIPGARRGLQPVKFAPLLAALGRVLGEDGGTVETWDIEPAPLDRWLIALRSFRPSRSRWRARFNADPAAFEARGRAALRLGRVREADALLQIGMTFDAGPAAHGRRLVIYTDYSVVLTRDLGREWRLSLSADQIERRIAQEARALALASHVCTRSALVAQALHDAQGVGWERLSVVGGGANLVPVGPRAAPPRLLFIGQDFRRKGGDIALAAFALLRQRYPWLEMDVLAPASARSAAMGVAWHSVIGTAEVAALMGRATIFLAPARFETWGDALIEAMSGGAVPVIADLAPMTEIARHEREGLIVPGEDPAALAAAVARLLEDEALRQRLSQAARDRIAGDLTQDHVARRIARVLRPGPATGV